MNDEPCTREHLQAAVNIYYMFDIEGDGGLGDCFQQWDEPSQVDETWIEEYHCKNCGEYFELEEHFSEEARVRAWQAALNHLTEQSEPVA